MTSKLYLIRQPARLRCTWVPTGDTTRPLACVWTETKAPQAVNTASATDEPGQGTGRMYLCA